MANTLELDLFPALIERTTLRDSNFGSAALSGLHDDLYILPQRDQEAHEALD